MLNSLLIKLFFFLFFFLFQIKQRRDPRFDSLSGKFNEDLFEKSYSFLNEYKKSEIEQIKNQINKEKDPDEKSKLQWLLSKLVSFF